MAAHQPHGVIAPPVVGVVVAVHLLPLGFLLWWAGDSGEDLFFLAGVSLPLLCAIVAAQLLVLAPWRRPAGLTAPGAGALVWTLPPLAAAGVLLVAGAGAPPALESHLLLILAGIVAAALAEEITFRGAVFGLLAHRGALVGVLGSSAVFGLAHMIALAGGAAPGAAASQSVGAFGLGLVLATVRLKTGSLAGPVVIHIAWNVAALSGDLRSGFLAEPAVAALVVAVLVIGLVALRVRRRVAIEV